MKYLMFIVLHFFVFQHTYGQITKNVLVEKYTSVYCGQCPDGAVLMNNITVNNPNVIWVSHHAGFTKDGMSIERLDTLADAFTIGTPMATVDRVSYTNSVGNVALFMSAWPSRIDTQLNKTAEVNVQVNGVYNPTTQFALVTIDATFQNAITANGSYRMNLFVVEDSVVGTGGTFDQVNYFNNTSGHYYENAGNPIIGYPHRHVVRKVPSTTWGTPSIIPNTPIINNTYSISYLVYLPNYYDVSKLSFVAFVTDYDENNIYERKVLNANKSLLQDFVVNTVETPVVIHDFGVQPNPATTFTNLVISSEEAKNIEIRITNLMGQTVYTNKNLSIQAGENRIPIDVQSISSGIYMVSILNDNTIVSKQLIIQR